MPKLEQLVSCGDNKEIIKIIRLIKFGVNHSFNYKNFLMSLYKNSLTIELNGKTKDKKEIKVLKLNSKKSKKIYDVINSQKDIS